MGVEGTSGEGIRGVNGESGWEGRGGESKVVG